MTIEERTAAESRIAELEQQKQQVLAIARQQVAELDQRKEMVGAQANHDAGRCQGMIDLLREQIDAALARERTPAT